MSKVKPKSTDSAVTTKTTKNTPNRKKNKSDKKNVWYVKMERLSKDQAKTKAMLPPKEVQQFSANWKTLLEVFKSNPPLESKPAQENSKKEEAHQKTTKDCSKKVPSHKKQTKDCLKSNATTTTTQTNPGAARKDKAGTSKSSVNGKSQVLKAKQPKAKKRKQDSTQEDGKGKTSKKKKVEQAEEKKTTEVDLWFDDVDPDDIEAAIGTEAADVMRKRQGVKKTNPEDTEKVLVKGGASECITKAVAMDCEMVGVGPDGEDSIVARVSLVNLYGKCIYDKHVKPTEKVTDYRTAVSGIRPEDIIDGEDVKTVQREVAEILEGRLLVGHAIHNDLKILLLDHPKRNIRDTQKYKPFKSAVKSGRPSLKLLCREILNVKVQQGEHSSVQDAQATMRLYTMAKKNWEAEIKASRKNADVTKKRKPKAPKKK